MRGATQKRCLPLPGASAAAAAHTQSIPRSQGSTQRELTWALARAGLPARAPLSPQQAAGEPGAHTGAAQALRRTLRALRQVLAATAQNLGVPSVLVNGDRPPPRLAPGGAAAVSTATPASQKPRTESYSGTFHAFQPSQGQIDPFRGLRRSPLAHVQLVGPHLGNPQPGFR